MSSLVPAAASSIMSSSATAATLMNPMDVLMTAVNTNPYFIGLMMLLLNLGGRFLALEITKGQEKFLSQPIVRRFFLFAVLFVATRNFVIAAGLAIIVIIMLGYLFNEHSELCLWRSCLVPTVKATDKPSEGFSGLTAEEAMILKRLQDKQMAGQPRGNDDKDDKDDNEKGEENKPMLASDLYNDAIKRLRTAFYRP
jgi:hypothetical protein